MPNTLFMLEYLEHVGINVNHFVDANAVKDEYLRQIYRLDSRSRMIGEDGKIIGKASNPRHLVVH